MPDKSALVTGGSRGIGRGIVLALARAGWAVTFSFRAAAAAAQAVAAEIDLAGGQAQAVQADIRRADDRLRLLETVRTRFGRLDLLVNNAGMAPRQRVDILELGEASYDEVMDTNLKGPFFLTQAAARVMLRQKDAETIPKPPTAMIINIGSLSANTSSTTRAEYCLSKAGVSMMTALFADRLASAGILVYEVRPGLIETDMTAGVFDKYERMIADGLLPLQRWGQPEDVARAVTALADGVLPYSTGEVIHIDGGFHLRRF
jgi:3-oxoacyl-[acyl-carrier protein] reductase